MAAGAAGAARPPAPDCTDALPSGPPRPPLGIAHKLRPAGRRTLAAWKARGGVTIRAPPPTKHARAASVVAEIPDQPRRTDRSAQSGWTDDKRKAFSTALRGRRAVSRRKAPAPPRAMTGQGSSRHACSGSIRCGVRAALLPPLLHNHVAVQRGGGRCTDRTALCEETAPLVSHRCLAPHPGDSQTRGRLSKCDTYLGRDEINDTLRFAGFRWSARRLGGSAHHSAADDCSDRWSVYQGNQRGPCFFSRKIERRPRPHWKFGSLNPAQRCQPPCLWGRWLCGAAPEAHRACRNARYVACGCHPVRVPAAALTNPASPCIVRQQETRIEYELGG